MWNGNEFYLPRYRHAELRCNGTPPPEAPVKPLHGLGFGLGDSIGLRGPVFGF